MSYPWSQAVLAYIIPRGSTTTSLAALVAQTQAAQLVNGETDLIGFTVAPGGDVTTTIAPSAQYPNGAAKRTLTLNLTTQFNQNLQPDADPASFFNNLYTIALEKATASPGQVQALPVLVS